MRSGRKVGSKPDEWDFRSIEFGDGISAYADGRERGKIDKWEKLRMEDWKLMQEQDFVKPEAATGDEHSIVLKARKVSAKKQSRVMYRVHGKKK